MKKNKIIVTLLTVSVIAIGGGIYSVKNNSHTKITASDKVSLSDDIPVLVTSLSSFDEYLSEWEKDNPDLDKNRVGLDILKEMYEEQKEMQNTDRYMGKQDEYNNFEEFLADWELMNPELDKNVVGVDSLKEIFEEHKNPQPFIIADEFDNNYKDFDEFLFNWEIVNSDLDKNEVGLHVLKEIYETRTSPTNPKWVDKFRN